jgi:hypothetical protein
MNCITAREKNQSNEKEKKSRAVQSTCPMPSHQRAAAALPASVLELGTVCPELLPLVEEVPKMHQLPVQAGNAVGVEGAHLVEVAGGVAEAAEVGRVHELHRHAVPRRELVLELVEHQLLVLARVRRPRLPVPVPVERHRPRARLRVHEPAVGPLVQVVRVVAVELVARHGDVGGHRHAQQRVPEPDDVQVLRHTVH